MSLTIRWISTSQSRYVVYLYDSSGFLPVSTAGFVTTACQGAGSSGFDGCMTAGNSSATSATWTIPGALNPNRYTVKVKVWSSTGQTAEAFSSAFTVSPSPLPSVSNVTVSPTSGSEGQSLTFRWSSTNQARYAVFLYNGSAFSPISTASIMDQSCTWMPSTGSDGCLVYASGSPATSTGWTVPGALQTGTYTIKVRVWSSAGQMAEAFSPSFTVTPSTLPKVSGVTASPQSLWAGKKLAVGWSSQNQERYAVFLYDSFGTAPVSTAAFLPEACRGLGSTGTDGCLTQASSATVTSATWTIPAALAAGSYTIKVMVWAFFGDTAEAFSPPFTVVPPPAPEVSDVTVSPVTGTTGTRLAISWSSANQDRYAVYLRDGAGLEAVSTASFLSPECIAVESTGADGCLTQAASAQATGAEWTIPARLPTGSYTVQVEVWNAVGQPASSTSSTIHMVTGPSGPCGDGLKGRRETCDGADLGGWTCTALGYSYGGKLACSASCDSFDESSCCSILDPGLSPPPFFASSFDTEGFAPDSPVRLRFDYDIPPAPPDRCRYESAAGARAELCIRLTSSSYECSDLDLTATSHCAAPVACAAPPAAQCDWERPCCATSARFNGESNHTWIIDSGMHIPSLNVGTSLSGSLGYTVHPGLEGALLRGTCRLPASGEDGAIARFSIRGSAPVNMGFTLFGEPVSGAEVGLSLCAGMSGPVESAACEDNVICSVDGEVRLDVSLPPIDIQWFRVEPRELPIIVDGNRRICP
jgi:hypothetical protein